MSRYARFLALLGSGFVALGGLAGAGVPDGRALTPAGFTIPVEGFASAHALSPDGHWLAVLSQDAGALDIISIDRSVLADRLAVSGATGLVWTTDGLYVTRGYSGIVARYAYAGPKLSLTKRVDLEIGAGGLINGIDEDPATHRIAVARTAEREVVVADDETGRTLERHPTSGQPYRVAFLSGALVASLYDSDHVDAWRAGSSEPVHVATGPHPTQLLADGDRVFVANADGHDVAVIDRTLTVARRYDLAVRRDAPPGQTPAGMALSADHTQLFVAESGLNDVAVVDLAGGRVLTRMPTAWYPVAVAYVSRATSGKDPRPKAQLWVTDAKGLGSQPDPGGEWDGTYTGLVQHILVVPTQFRAWNATVAHDDRLDVSAPSRDALPPIKHIVFIVRENKHFDESFGDEPQADVDPALLLYGRHFTPNAHAMAEAYTLFDNFMGNGEASIFGHSWTTQGMANDYHERNGHTKDPPPGVTPVATAIWPYPFGGEDSVTPADMDFDWFRDLADLPKGPRINVSGVFGPRGELIDGLQRKRVSFRVYGEQMTMLPDGRIAPGLAAHAARDFPGDHINFNVLDTERARLFLSDVARNGLASYSYMTLSTDHTAGSTPGFYTPASYVANNDFALGTIIEGLSKRPDWKNTIVFVTCDDAQGTGDHLDSHRMPAFAVGPYVRRSYVDHTHYSYPSFLRLTELALGLDPLNTEDAFAPPMLDFFARQPSVTAFVRRPQEVAMERNPGMPSSVSYELDGPDSIHVPEQEWRSIKGDIGYAQHVAYLRLLGAVPQQVAAGEGDDR